MNKIFEAIAVPKIIGPGEIYIFNDYEDLGSDAGPIEYMYFIKEDEEIIPALDMRMSCLFWYELKEFISWARVSPTSFEFKMLCYDTEGESIVEHSYFLHRLRTVQEALAEALNDLTDSET